MSELAFNANGESFEFPPEVTDLRTRRMKMRGAPELVYGRDGRPVTVPVTANIDELREAVGGVAGKYRLDPLNADGKLVEGVPAAYVQIIPLQPEPTSIATVHTPSGSETESVLRDAIRTNAELARTVISTFPSMMESAARLIEAADGAGIARRKPRYLEVVDDDQDDEEDEDREEALPARTQGGLDVNALVAQVVPVVVMGIMNGKFDLSKLGELLDWRKAAASGKKAAAEKATGPTTKAPTSAPRATSSMESKARAATPPAPAASSEEAENDEALPPHDPAAMAHFLAIQSALTADEAAMAREVASSLSPRELRAWMGDLRSMSVADAVAMIRKHIHTAPQAQESVS